MKLTDWKDRFAPRILRRGEDYFYNGAVRSMDWDGETITAVVSGTDDYEVEITVSGGQAVEMSCSCPYAESDNCKHMAAVLFAASQDDFPGAVKKKTVSKRGASGHGSAAAMPLEKAAQSLNAADARALLLRFAKVYPDIAEQIMLKATGSVTKQQIQAWNKRIIRLTVQYSDRSGFIDYRNAGRYTGELESLLDEKVPVLLDCGLPMDAFRLVCKALEEASEIDMDDSDGGLGGLYWDCEKHWRAILPHMHRAERHEVFDWFQENYTRWDVADEIFDAFLFGGPHEEAAFQEEEFLRRKLDLLDEQIAKAKEDSYDMNRFTLRRVETMEKLSMDRTEIEAYLQKHRQIRSIRKHTIDMAVREARYDDAVALLKESMEIDAKYAGCVSEYSNRLLELYQTMDRVEDLRAELLFQMEHIRQDNLEHVNLLKELTPNEQWPDLRERLLSLRNLENLRGSLLEREGLYDRLLEYVLDSKSAYLMDRYLETLETRYPKEVLTFYADCLREDMKQAANRTQYAEQARRLKKLARLRGGKEAAAALMDEWRSAYPRRRAMFEELQKTGF